MNNFLYVRLILAWIKKTLNTHQLLLKNLKMNNLGKKLKKCHTLLLNLNEKKVKYFKKQLKKTENNENYKFGNLLIERHFLFKALQEVK